MPINPHVKTIQLVYDSTSALLFTNAGNNYQIPLQGAFNIILKQAEIISGTDLLLVVKSPQLRTSYTCSNTNGTNGVQTTLAIPPLSNNYILSHRSGANTVTTPILFPRCFIQNTIQMNVVNLGDNTPLATGNTIIFTLEFHPCDEVLDTSKSLF